MRPLSRSRAVKDVAQGAFFWAGFVASKLDAISKHQVSATSDNCGDVSAKVPCIQSDGMCFREVPKQRVQLELLLPGCRHNIRSHDADLTPDIDVRTFHDRRSRRLSFVCQSERFMNSSRTVKSLAPR